MVYCLGSFIYTTSQSRLLKLKVYTDKLLLRLNKNKYYADHFPLLFVT
jgi:hypothetical protein